MSLYSHTYCLRQLRDDLRDALTVLSGHLPDDLPAATEDALDQLATVLCVLTTCADTHVTVLSDIPADDTDWSDLPLLSDVLTSAA
jgi:hypothetical protein